ncbi:MAG: N-acetylmuramoyl-L-alanine amidase [Candidatus Marinimicrobia bacterium]|nr:N-acetylmuramoyl-L-alanine amidase [Candidatus Neomarinimicrobiota bacterium]
MSKTKKVKKLILIITILISTSLFSQDLSGVKICIDPGHGGHESDDRHIIATDFWESEGNLTKAKRLREMLTALGATVILTREGNGNDWPDDLSLSARAGIANNNNVDFFHSIHSNGYNGQWNSTLMLFDGYDNDPVYDDSKIMADIMAPKLYNANRTTHYSVRGDYDFYGWTDSQGNPIGLGVLRRLTMPGVLSEGSFHDYIPESWRLQNLDYRKKEAWAIAQSFVDFYNTSNYGIRHIAGLVRDKYDKVSYYTITSSDEYTPINNITATLTPGNIVYTGGNMNNGFFFFDSLATGTYQVKVEADDYHSDSANIIVGSSFFNFKDFYLISNAPPELLSTYPTEGDTCIPSWYPIVLNFNKPIDTTTVDSAISISPNTPFEFSYDDDFRQINITAKTDSFLFLTPYTLTVSDSLKDKWGYNFDADGDTNTTNDYVLNFTTGKEDMSSPNITSIYPKSGGNNVILNPILKFVYDEILDSASVTADKFYFEKYSGHHKIECDLVHNIVNNQSVIHLFPKEQLRHNELYKRIIYKGLNDLFDNPTPSNLAFTFMTGSNKYEITLLDSFENYITNNWLKPSISGKSLGLLDTTNRKGNSEYLNLLTGSQQSLEVSYGFDTTETEWLLREYAEDENPVVGEFDDSYTMQVYIFGDGSGNKFRFCVDDDNGNEVSEWTTINWLGWKLVSWNLNSIGTWSDGNSDGTLDGTLHFDSFQLTYNSENSSPNIGKIYFDDLRIVKSVYASINENNTLPNTFTLFQNYPNPFNPKTVIEYNIPKNSNVKLNIYDLSGKKITSLVDEFQNSGFHSVEFNGNKFASGIYLYQLLTDDFSEVKKMVLIK